MANQKISEKTAVVTLTGVDILPVVQGGVTKKATVQQIVDVATSSLTTHEALTTTAHGGLLQIGTTATTALAGNTPLLQIGTTATTAMAGNTTIPAAYTHPSGDGNLHVPATSTTNSGKVLTAGATAGSLSWVTPASSGLPVSTKTNADSPVAAVKNNIYQCDTSGGAIIVMLPTGVAGDYLELWDFAGTWGAAAATVVPAGGEKINGQAIDATLVLNVNNARVAFAYTDTVRGWQIDIGGNGSINAALVNVDATGFNGNLTTADTTIQAVAQKVDDLILGASLKLNVAVPAGAFSLIGAASEPIYQVNADSNHNYSSLEYVDGATEWNAFFSIPSKRTAQYGGTSDIKIDIDFCLVGGTLTAGSTVVFGVGLVSVADGSTVNTAPPTTGTGYGTVAYTLGGSETTLFKRTVSITVSADASIAAGQYWVGRLIRKTATDTSVATARVLGITVYE